MLNNSYVEWLKALLSAQSLNVSCVAHGSKGLDIPDLVFPLFVKTEPGKHALKPELHRCQLFSHCAALKDKIQKTLQNMEVITSTGEVMATGFTKTKCVTKFPENSGGIFNVAESMWHQTSANSLKTHHRESLRSFRVRNIHHLV